MGYEFGTTEQGPDYEMQPPAYETELLADAAFIGTAQWSVHFDSATNNFVEPCTPRTADETQPPSPKLCERVDLFERAPVYPNPKSAKKESFQVLYSETDDETTSPLPESKERVKFLERTPNYSRSKSRVSQQNPLYTETENDGHGTTR